MDKRFPPQLQEPINGKLADVVVSLGDNRRAIFEITSLDPRDKLRYIGFESNMGNKAKGIILDKIRKQISTYALGNNDLIFLVIDKTRAYDISPEDVYHALEGSTGFVLLKNKETHEVVGTKAVRQPDAIGETVKDGDKLSAVILYNIFISTENNSVRLQGEIFANPYARVKVDNLLLDNLKSILFE